MYHWPGCIAADEMISRETIRQAVHLLVEAAHPSKVILFGSYATGAAREDSDVDFLVVEPTVAHRREEMAVAEGYSTAQDSSGCVSGFRTGD
jgi:predicted nucleotidyltransferase